MNGPDVCLIVMLKDLQLRQMWQYKCSSLNDDDSGYF